MNNTPNPSVPLSNTTTSKTNNNNSNNGTSSNAGDQHKKKLIRHNRTTLRKKPSSSTSPNGTSNSYVSQTNGGTHTASSLPRTITSPSNFVAINQNNNNNNQGTTTPSKVIHFRRIPIDTTQNDLMNMCQPFGAVTNILLLKNGQGLVQFAELEGAISLIESFNNNPDSPSFVIRDTKVYPNYSSHTELSKGLISKTDNGIANNGKQQDPNHILLVTISKSKSADVTIDSLHEIFSLAGSCPIEKIVMFNKTAGLQALIQYKNVNDALEARKKLQGETPFSSSETLLIQFSNLKDLTVHQNSDKARDYTKPLLPTTPPQAQQSPTSVSSPTTTTTTTTTTTNNAVAVSSTLATTTTNNVPTTVMKRSVQQTANPVQNNSTTMTPPQQPQQPIVHQLQDQRSRSNSASSGAFEHHQVVIQHQPTQHVPPNNTPISFMNNLPSSAINNSPNVTNTSNSRVSMTHLPENNASVMSASFFSYAPFAHRETFGAFSPTIPSAHHPAHSTNHQSNGNPHHSHNHHHHHHHPTNSVQNQFLNHSFLSSTTSLNQTFSDKIVMSPSGVVVQMPDKLVMTNPSSNPNGGQYHLLNGSFTHIPNSIRNGTPNTAPKNTTLNGIISAPSSSLSNENGNNQIRLNLQPTNQSPTSTTTATTATSSRPAQPSLGTIGSSRLLSNPPTTLHTPTTEETSNIEEEMASEDNIDVDQEDETAEEGDFDSKDNGGANNEKSSVLLVSNFNDKKMNCDLLFNLFSCYGYIYRIKIFKTKPDHALVQMASHKQALNAINSLKGVQIFGKTLSVNFSKHTFINTNKSDNNMKDFTKTNLNRFPRGSSATTTSQSSPSTTTSNNGSLTNGKQHNKLYMCQPTHTLHISNVPFEKDDKGKEILTNIFSQFGEIEGLRVFRHNDKPMALIKFKTITSSAEALATLHNDTISGKHMKVAFSLNSVFPKQ